MLQKLNDNKLNLVVMLAAALTMVAISPAKDCHCELPQLDDVKEPAL